MGPSPQSPDLATTGGSADGSDPSDGGDKDAPLDPMNDDGGKDPPDDGGEPPADDDGTTGDPPDDPTTGGSGEDPPSVDVPATWTCDPTYYGAADGCDCGCGALDPDCADATAAACEYCDGCGLVGGSCAEAVQADDNTVCIPADCGDGAVQGGEVCDGAPPKGATCADFGFTGGDVGCSATTCNADLSACTGGPMPGWTCPPAYYGTADGCDCGCGIVDPDCADANGGSCEYCGAIGSCMPIGAACDTVDATNNALCG